MKFLKKAFSWVKAKVGLGFGFVRDHQFISVEVVNHVKSIVRSPLVKVGVSLIPGKFAPKVLQILDSIILPILTEVAEVHGIINKHEKNSESVDLIIQRMRLLFPDKEAQIYADFGARLNERLSDGIVTGQESWDQVQDTYYTFFKNK